jgi:alpha-tubulin suppressor-like RCC1 family protein
MEYDLSQGQGILASGQRPERELKVGGHHVCVSQSTGTALHCWGRNDLGQIGIGTTKVRHVLHPVPVDIGGVVQHFSLGKFHNCAVRTTGVLLCWGGNSDGQLGDGTQEDRWVPTEIQTGGRAASAYAGFRHSCALLENGELQCWGRNEEGQLGDGTIGVPYKFHGANSQLTPRTVDVGGTVTSVMLGAEHMCVALDSHEVQCWGDNKFGQLGNGTRRGPGGRFPDLMRSPTPVGVDLGGAKIIRLLGAPKFSTCAEMNNGSVSCWGHVDYGFPAATNSKISTGFADPNNYQSSPVLYPVTGPFVQVAVGGYHMCSVTEFNNHMIQCSGFNNCGQVGDGTMLDRSTPVPIAIGGSVAYVGVGTSFSCAMRDDARVFCWGENQDGVMGDGTIVTERSSEWWAPERGDNGVGVLSPQEAGIVNATYADAPTEGRSLADAEYEPQR